MQLGVFYRDAGWPEIIWTTLVVGRSPDDHEARMEH